jgi:hypothetical protein
VLAAFDAKRLWFARLLVDEGLIEEPIEANVCVQFTEIKTSIFPRVARETGQIERASSTRVCASSRSIR